MRGRDRGSEGMRTTTPIGYQDKRQRASQESNSQAEIAIKRAIRAIPKGKVASYGQVAEAAGYPRHHRQVAQVLRKSNESLPWHRVLGANGEIKKRGEWGFEQRTRLLMEGVRFRGARVDMGACRYVFETNRFADDSD
jgi:methylated-DNA-protein-cysteine methyltransferase related protein